MPRLSLITLLQWDTRHLGNTPRLMIEIGVASALLYTFTKVHFDLTGSLTKAALILSSLACLLPYGRTLWRHPAFSFLGIALGYTLFQWVFLSMTMEALAEDYPKLDHVARLFIFLLLAWWLAGSTRNTLILWMVAATAVVLSPWIAGEGLAGFQRGFQGERVGFGIRNVQHAAMFFGATLLGLLIFAPRLAVQTRGRLWKLPIWGGALCIVMAGVLVAQTRATWLGLLAALAALGLALMWYQRRRLGYLPLVGLLCGIALLAGLTQSPLVAERLSAEGDVIYQLLQGDWSGVPLSSDAMRSSVGERLYSWRGAWELITQRPLLGWGDNGIEWLFETIDYNQEHYQALEFGHLHNLYLEITLQYGLVGLAGYLGLLGWLTHQSLRAWRAGRMPGDILLFTMAFLIFWSVVNLFESYWFFWTGALLFNIVMAGCLTHIWKPAMPCRERTTA